MPKRTDVPLLPSLSLRPFFGKAFRQCVAHPKLFLVLSLPALVAEAALEFMPPPEGQPPVAYATLFLPVIFAFCFLTEASCAAFYLWMRDSDQAERLSARNLLRSSLSFWTRWYPPVLCSVFLILAAGFLVLPAIYFMTVFAFITPCAIENPKAKTLDILVISRRLVHMRFWKIFPIACVLGILEAVMSFGLTELADKGISVAWVGGVPFWFTAVVGMGVKLISVSFHSYVSMFEALLFIYLWREREQIRLRNIGTHSAV